MKQLFCRYYIFWCVAADIWLQTKITHLLRFQQFSLLLLFYAGECISPAKWWRKVSHPGYDLAAPFDTARPMRPAKPATPRPIPPTIAMPTKPSEGQGAKVRKCISKRKIPNPASALVPFFKALSMSFSSSRACLFPGSFFRRVRMYFRAFSYSWKIKKANHPRHHSNCVVGNRAVHVEQNLTWCDSIKHVSCSQLTVMSLWTQSSRREGDHLDLQAIKTWFVIIQR